MSKKKRARGLPNVDFGKPEPAPPPRWPTRLDYLIAAAVLLALALAVLNR